MQRRRLLMSISALLTLSIAPCTLAADDSAWPERIVGIDKMHMLTPMNLRVPTPFAIDRSKTSTVVLHLLVTELGKPSQVRVEQSSGNANIDETVLRAAWKVSFEPYRVDDQPVPVTVVAPMHVPFVERRR